MTTTIQKFNVTAIDLGPAPNDPWAERDVTFTAPDGAVRIVPALIKKERWIVRYSSGIVGEHRWSSEETEGTLTVTERNDRANGLNHGPLVVSEDQRHLQHADGTPFLWLADTWWHAFVSVKCSDDEFVRLAAQRAEQGFSVVQLVAGLPCEIGPFDEAGRARAGWAWEPGFAAPNLAWWDDADARVMTLLDNGLMPCILGSWGYHLSMMSIEQLTRHWREMIARWGAYPVVWCIAGEPRNAWYEDLGKVLGGNAGALIAGRNEKTGGESGTPDPAFAEAAKELAATVSLQLRVFNELTAQVREMEPFDRLITTHTVPSVMPWEFLADENLVDFWFLQTGHFGHASLEPTIAAIRQSLDHKPMKPVVNGEVNYEGIAGSSWEDIQRFLFWSHFISGAAGFSYGAHGVWAFNTDEFPGQFSGFAPRWKDAASFTGAAHVGIGRQILIRYPWHELRPAEDIVNPHSSGKDIFKPYAGHLSDGRRLIYFPSMAFNGGLGNPTLLNLGDQSWQATPIDLTTGRPHLPTTITPNADGTGAIPGLFWSFPSWGDWLLEIRPA